MHCCHVFCLNTITSAWLYGALYYIALLGSTWSIEDCFFMFCMDLILWVFLLDLSPHLTEWYISDNIKMFPRICLHTNFLFGFFPKNLFVFFLFCFFFTGSMIESFCRSWLLWQLMNIIWWDLNSPYFISFETWFCGICDADLSNIAHFLVGHANLFFKFLKKLFHHSFNFQYRLHGPQVHSLNIAQSLVRSSHVLNIERHLFFFFYYFRFVFKSAF